mmetsp:Transcript_12473/g.31564  ORF Transcript_12473/g.31564 Transcript_12473/m.31564 type:complete len:313 (-) Transcript_12473:411-1349(-)
MAKVPAGNQESRPGKTPALKPRHARHRRKQPKGAKSSASQHLRRVKSSSKRSRQAIATVTPSKAAVAAAFSNRMYFSCNLVGPSPERALAKRKAFPPPFTASAPSPFPSPSPFSTSRVPARRFLARLALVSTIGPVTLYFSAPAEKCARVLPSAALPLPLAVLLAVLLAPRSPPLRRIQSSSPWPLSITAIGPPAPLGSPCGGAAARDGGSLPSSSSSLSSSSRSFPWAGGGGGLALGWRLMAEKMAFCLIWCQSETRWALWPAWEAMPTTHMCTRMARCSPRRKATVAADISMKRTSSIAPGKPRDSSDTI